MKISKAQAKMLADHKQQLRSDRLSIKVQFDRLLDELTRIVEPINRAIETHNDHVAAARLFVAVVGVELRDAFDEKSERWHESDAGQAADAMASEWEDARLEAVEPVRVLLPDAPHFEEGLNLPEESE